MEVVVSLGIFSIVSLVIVDIYLGANKEERRTLTRGTATHDTRFLVETIARDVRLGTVDYSYYMNAGLSVLRDGSGNLVPQDTLALVLSDGTNVYYSCNYSHWSSPSIPGPPIPISCSSMPAFQAFFPDLIPGDPDIDTSTDRTTWSSLSLEGVGLQSVHFTIEPPVDPRASDTLPADRIQPRVTIAIASQGRGRTEEQQVRTLVQTTVTSRSYGP